MTGSSGSTGADLWVFLSSLLRLDLVRFVFSGSRSAVLMGWVFFSALSGDKVDGEWLRRSRLWTTVLSCNAYHFRPIGFLQSRIYGASIWSCRGSAIGWWDILRIYAPWRKPLWFFLLLSFVLLLGICFPCFRSRLFSSDQGQLGSRFCYVVMLACLVSLALWSVLLFLVGFDLIWSFISLVWSGMNHGSLFVSTQNIILWSSQFKKYYRSV